MLWRVGDNLVDRIYAALQLRCMAKNGPKGRGRNGTVKKRTQVFSGRNKRWTKVDGKTGKFMDQMSHKGKPFKGVKIK